MTGLDPQRLCPDIVGIRDQWIDAPSRPAPRLSSRTSETSTGWTTSPPATRHLGEPMSYWARFSRYEQGI
jgi:hypothetical protein